MQNIELQWFHWIEESKMMRNLAKVECYQDLRKEAPEDVINTVLKDKNGSTSKVTKLHNPKTKLRNCSLLLKGRLHKWPSNRQHSQPKNLVYGMRAVFPDAMGRKRHRRETSSVWPTAAGQCSFCDANKNRVSDPKITFRVSISSLPPPPPRKKLATLNFPNEGNCYSFMLSHNPISVWNRRRHYHC